MYYVSTYPFMVAGKLVAELDVRLSIKGKARDWSIEAVELDEITGRGGNDRWFQIDSKHELHAAITAWAHSAKADDIESDYCEYLDACAEDARERAYEARLEELRWGTP
mgnify:CR=1 FL=1